MNQEAEPVTEKDLEHDIRIDPNGEIHQLDEPEEEYTLEYLQDQVQGYIELIPCCPFKGRLALANEEGICQGLEYNTRASVTFKQPLVGPIVILRSERMK
jgi:hypothetical protein